MKELDGTEDYQSVEKVRSVGHGIRSSSPGSWKFQGTSSVFDDHVVRSIPGYSSAHYLVAGISDNFLSDGDVHLDAGCSTGALLRSVANRHQGKQVSFVGVDIEPEMVAFAQANTDDERIQFEVADLLYVDYRATLISSVFTLQFVRPQARQELVNKWWNQLQWGGALCLVEKVRGSDARFQDILTGLYWDWKSEQGFSDEEIIGKWRSLRRAMEPFSPAGNEELLRRSGFTDIETFWKWGPFQAWLAIK